MPPSRVCYCRTEEYAGLGGNAETAEFEHFLSNNLKSCRVDEEEGAPHNVCVCGLIMCVWGASSGHLLIRLAQRARSQSLLGLYER